MTEVPQSLERREAGRALLLTNTMILRVVGSFENVAFRDMTGGNLSVSYRSHCTTSTYVLYPGMMYDMNTEVYRTCPEEESGGYPSIAE